MNLLILAPASVLNWLSICSTADNLYMPREVFNNLLQNSSQTLSRSWVLKLYWEWGIYRFYNFLLKSFRTIFVPIQFPCRGGEQIRRVGVCAQSADCCKGKQVKRGTLVKDSDIVSHAFEKWGRGRSGDMALGFIRLCWFQVKMSYLLQQKKIPDIFNTKLVDDMW